jgi:hypothetical protein
MERRRRGNSTAGCVSYFLRLFVNTRDSLRVGMMEDKTPITTTKITGWQRVDFTVIRSASLLATPVRTSSSLVSTLASQNPTFVALFTVTLSKFMVHGPQLHTFLTGQGCTVETVTIIRERSTGTCPSTCIFPGQYD